MNRIRPFLWVLLIPVVLSGCAQDDSFRLYLFRHAEKTTESPDPGLTAPGQQRARKLADFLSQHGIEAIYSSNYRRTRETVLPLGEETGLVIELYDPRDLESLAQRLRTAAQNAAVVGHSNTTPELAALVSGLPTEAMEETEYDRLYEITLRKNPENPAAEIRIIHQSEI